MAIIKRGTCKITTLNEIGCGVADLDSGMVQIPYTIPGETVTFEMHKYRDQNSFVLSEILEKSSNRVLPPCEYFGICGGCSLQHLSYEYYNQYKIETLRKTLADHGVVVPKILPIKSVDPSNRRRAVFQCVKKHDQLFLGFKKFRSDKIVNINKCLLLLPALSDLIQYLKSLLFSILEHKEKCKIVVTQASNGIDVLIDIGICGKNFKDYLNKDLSVECKANNIIKLTIISNAKWYVLHLAEEPYVLLSGYKISIDSNSFLQASSQSDHILDDILQDFFSTRYLNDRCNIVDLFCGRGTLAIPASKFGAVEAFELDQSAVKALDKSSAIFKVSKRDLFLDPLKWDELNKYDVAMINPPRAGAKLQCEILATSTIKTILYVSCNPQTFARDAKIITHNNYQLSEIIPIDQFYWSHHLEVVGVFDRKSFNI